MVYRPRNYLEIGVNDGRSLTLSRVPTVAVDPAFKVTSEVSCDVHMVKATSDAFFGRKDPLIHLRNGRNPFRALARRDPLNLLGGDPRLELAFIDGMHQFEFALRDFANLERFCTRDSTILIDDCYPLNRETAERERRRDFWSGDIWRLILLLKKYRPDLAIHIVATPPTGLAVVRRLDPDSRFLREHHERLCREFLAVDYAFLEDDMPGKLNLFPNDWAQIRALLG